MVRGVDRLTCHSTAARVVKDHEPSRKDEDMDPTTTLQRFEKQKTVLLTTYKRDGSGVGTPVSLAVEGGHAFFRTYDRSCKAKRLRRDQHVLVAPSTLRGAPTGDPIRGVARLLDGDEGRHAAAKLRDKHPVLHGLMVPLMHRVRRYKTLHYEFSPEPQDLAESRRLRRVS
jgi:PPOX class probable F420-dependent enzyme